MDGERGLKIMTQTQVNALAKSYPIPSKIKMDRCVERLERMSEFYESKAPTSKDGGALFNSFSLNLM